MQESHHLNMKKMLIIVGKIHRRFNEAKHVPCFRKLGITEIDASEVCRCPHLIACRDEKLATSAVCTKMLQDSI